MSLVADQGPRQLGRESSICMYGPHAGTPDHPCWWCRWWAGVDGSGRHGLCSRPKSSRVQALPERGCAHYELEPGADCDLDWSPVVVTPSPAVWAPQSAPPEVGPLKWAP